MPNYWLDTWTTVILELLRIVRFAVEVLMDNLNIIILHSFESAIDLNNNYIDKFHLKYNNYHDKMAWYYTTGEFPRMNSFHFGIQAFIFPG